MADLPNPGRATSPLIVWPVAAIVLLLTSMALWPDVLMESSLVDFLLVTVFLGCGAAWLTGRAVAKSWGPYAKLFVYCGLLTFAVRFAHFALFERPLLSAHHYVVEFILIFAVATLGLRAVRQRQMTVQYGWLYERTGPLTWRPRAAASGAQARE